MLRRKIFWAPLVVCAAFLVGCAGDVASTPSNPDSSNQAPTNSTGATDQPISVVADAGAACTLSVEGMT